MALNMRIDELDISKETKEALSKLGFVELYPPQAKAIPLALTGRNLMVSIPTAAGKSLIGIVPALNVMLRERGKVLYIVPLKALASEKRDDLECLSNLGFKVMMSSGDMDSDDGALRSADIIIATSEKADSMLRHGSKWMEDVRLVIADEIHLIHDPGRGPTLEMVLTKLMRRNKGTQIIALSATISNAEDVARWIGGDLVIDTWRPIGLKEGVYYNETIEFDDRSSVQVPGSDPIWAMIEQTVRDGGQSLIFVNSRRSTESVAVKYSTKMGKMFGKSMSDDDAKNIEEDSDSTSVGKKLAICVSNGMAFHNAGLTYAQRRFVEENFKKRNIKCIVATPTLAAGINLPARRVIVRDTSRFDMNSGTSSPLPIMEVKQMCGRAGRPGYDPYGEAILIAKSESSAKRLMSYYFESDSERITSKLNNEMTLRSHILGLIATGDAESEEDIVDFMRGTFFGSTSQLYGIESLIESVVGFLVKEGMIMRDGDRLSPMPFGKRVSDLYIDPKSAMVLKDTVLEIGEGIEDLILLHAVASTPDVLGMYPKKCDEERIEEAMAEYEDRFMTKAYDGDMYYWDAFNADLKVALMVREWIEESSEEYITDSMGIGPGDIRSRTEMFDWMLYSMNEIAYIFRPEITKMIKPMLTRIRYGIKEELLQLVAYRGVGRVRARMLYNHGIRSRSDIAAADFEVLANMATIGPALARSLKEQAGGRMPTEDRYRGVVDDPRESEQSRLMDFE